jgi:hypothetical protein
MHVQQAGAVLTRIANEAMHFTAAIAPRYREAPFFDHLREMFTAHEVRQVEHKLLSRVVPPEFQLYSTDLALSELLRDLDVHGHHIVFPQTTDHTPDHPSCGPAYHLARYEITRPKEQVDRQYLRVLITFILDFTEGATHFIKAMAKQLSIASPERRRRK